MKTIEYQKLKWIDILNPTDEDLKFLKEKFPFHHIIIEEIKTPTYHPIIESYKDYLFWIIHIPHRETEHNEIIKAYEVDFLITSDVLITVRYNDFSDFEEIFQTIQKNPEKFLDKTTGHVFHHIVKKLFNKTSPELDKIKEAIDEIEDRIFESFNEELIEDIAKLKRQAIDFLKAVKPQKSVWDNAFAVTLEFWGERIKPYISDLIADYNKIVLVAETHKEVIDSLHLTSSSLLDNKRNYVIKILTVFTAIILPLSLFASIYGMNLSYLPLAKDRSSFWIFLGGMFAVTAGMLLYFKHKKWI